MKVLLHLDEAGLETSRSLVELSEGLAHSRSRVEDIFWKAKLDNEIQRNLLESDENSLTTALNRLADRESRAYEELADAIEGNVEHQTSSVGEKEFDFLLFAIPILAWSRGFITHKNSFKITN